MKKYYKILNQNEKHHGLQYKTGLNIDPIPFNPNGSCEPGGIYYVQKDILAFLNYGPWIREVKIPENAQVYKDPETVPKKWKADCVILGRKYRLTTKKIQKLINEGANIHAGNDQALRWASYYGYTETVKLLLENGANVHTVDNYAIRLASKNGHLETVKLLLENGADIHALDDFAIRFASYKGHLETVKLLLENGADIHALDDLAIRYASESGHTEVVELLKNWKSV